MEVTKVIFDSKYSTTRKLMKSDISTMIDAVKTLNKPEDKFETILFLPEGRNRQGEGGLRTQGYFKRSYDDKPLITVVTVVYNGEEFLEETILSVINQTYDNVECIIIDGGSTDDTLDIIKKYEHAIDYWVSEKDVGIYDAMNKGISLSSGELINFMNAGDRFIDSGVFSYLDFKILEKNEILVGDAKYLSGKIFQSLKHPIYLKNSIHHQAAFYPISLFKKLGFYSLDYSILSDYEKNYRAIKNGFYFIKHNYIFVLCSDGGVSDKPNFINYKEEIEIRNKLLNSRFISYALSGYTVFRYLCKRFFK
jgi:glycosyltransferase involved in cell wall biosynthesis